MAWEDELVVVRGILLAAPAVGLGYGLLVLLKPYLWATVWALLLGVLLHPSIKGAPSCATGGYLVSLSMREETEALCQHWDKRGGNSLVRTVLCIGSLLLMAARRLARSVGLSKALSHPHMPELSPRVIHWAEAVLGVSAVLIILIGSPRGLLIVLSVFMLIGQACILLARPLITTRSFSSLFARVFTVGTVLMVMFGVSWALTGEVVQGVQWCRGTGFRYFEEAVSLSRDMFPTAAQNVSQLAVDVLEREGMMEQLREAVEGVDELARAWQGDTLALTNATTKFSNMWTNLGSRQEQVQKVGQAFMQLLLHSGVWATRSALMVAHMTTGAINAISDLVFFALIFAYLHSLPNTWLTMLSVDWARSFQETVVPRTRALICCELQVWLYHWFCTWVVFSLCGVKFKVLISLVMATFSLFLPIFKYYVSCLPAYIKLVYFDGAMSSAFILFIVHSLLRFVVGEVWLYQGVPGMPPYIMSLGMILGVMTFGIGGAVTGPLLLILIYEAWRHILGAQLSSSDGGKDCDKNGKKEVDDEIDGSQEVPPRHRLLASHKQHD